METKVDNLTKKIWEMGNIFSDTERTIDDIVDEFNNSIHRKKFVSHDELGGKVFSDAGNITSDDFDYIQTIIDSIDKTLDTAIITK